MFGRSAKFKIETDRLTLRTLRHNDFRNWVELRTSSRDFLTPWDPVWSSEHLTRKSFTNRVYWAQRAVKAGSGYPLFLIHKIDKNLVGAVTLDNIRRGPSQVGTLGYWIGQPYARQGFMREAVGVVVKHAFQNFDILRKFTETIRCFTVKTNPLVSFLNESTWRCLLAIRLTHCESPADLQATRAGCKQQH